MVSNVNIFALVISWRECNGLDAPPFKAGVHTGKSIILSGCHVPLLQLLNGLSNYVDLQEGKREGKKQKRQSRKGTDFSLLSESDEGLLCCKGVSLKRR